MHNIKDIRKNPDIYKSLLKSRNVDLDLKKTLELDEMNRKLIQDKEKFESEKKEISKKKDDTQFEYSKKISKKIIDLSNQQRTIQNELNNILNSIPNLPLSDVPIGDDEKK